MEAFWISFGIIFVAELGDKSQLMAMTFAARYRAITILIAITAATALVHLFSVLLGAAVGVALPTKAIAVVAGLAFFVFAAWTLRGDQLDEGEIDASRANEQVRLLHGRRSHSSWPSSATRRCSRRSPSPPTTGSSAPGSDRPSAWSRPTPSRSVVGQQLGARLPGRVVKIGAAITFVVFGLLLIAEGLS